MQALDNAIAYRRAILGTPCADCGPGQRCRDHAADARLIAAYQRRHHAAYLQACAALDLDPDAPGASAAAAAGDTQALTDLALAEAMLAWMRKRAAGGPVLTDLGDGPAVYVLDGDGALAEYPVAGLLGYLAAAPENLEIAP